MKILEYTPVEQYDGIYVKREDLCSPLPISKIRGAWYHIWNRPAETVFVCIDTWRSLNGLITAAVCSALGKSCVMVYPVYKANKSIPPQQLLGASEYGAQLLGVPAGRQRIMITRTKRLLGHPGRLFGGGYYVMPNAFRLVETKDEIAKQYRKTLLHIGVPDHVIVPTGTGTHLEGILREVQKENVWAVLGYSSHLKISHPRMRVIDRNYSYKDQDNYPTPFPASPYYEAKAWRWLKENPLKGKVLFWNIGSDLSRVLLAGFLDPWRHS